MPQTYISEVDAKTALNHIAARRLMIALIRQLNLLARHIDLFPQARDFLVELERQPENLFPIRRCLIPVRKYASHKLVFRSGFIL